VHSRSPGVGSRYSFGFLCFTALQRHIVRTLVGTSNGPSRPTLFTYSVLAMGGKRKLLQRIAELEHRLDRHVPRSRSRDRSGSCHRRTRKRDSYSRTSASRTPSRDRSHSPSRHRRTAAGRKPRPVSTGRQRQHSYLTAKYETCSPTVRHLLIVVMSTARAA
jgi:hypothetical protein